VGHVRRNNYHTFCHRLYQHEGNAMTDKSKTTSDTEVALLQTEAIVDTLVDQRMALCEFILERVPGYYPPHIAEIISKGRRS
jgi:hypothetical protein